MSGQKGLSFVSWGCYLSFVGSHDWDWGVSVTSFAGLGITESLLQYCLWHVYFGQSLLIGLFIVDATVGWRMRQ